jgi:hypothetical protein
MMKRCRKMKWMQTARVGSMGRKRDMMRRRGDMSTGGEAAPRREREEIMPVELTRILLGQKIKKIHAVD